MILYSPLAASFALFYVFFALIFMPLASFHIENKFQGSLCFFLLFANLVSFITWPIIFTFSLLLFLSSPATSACALLSLCFFRRYSRKILFHVLLPSAQELCSSNIKITFPNVIFEVPSWLQCLRNAKEVLKNPINLQHYELVIRKTNQDHACFLNANQGNLTDTLIPQSLFA